MSTVTSAPHLFMDSLAWVHCIFCLKAFSQAQQFLVFSCDAIACHDCAKKLYSREENKMMCVHCKKKVNYLPIREEMPANVRRMFESPLKLGYELVQIHNYQQRHRTLIQNRVRLKVEGMKQMVNERRHQTQQCVRETEKIRELPHREQILKVISEDRLDQLLQLDEEQLQKMTFEQIKGTPTHIRPARRSSRQFDIAPIDVVNTASTPTTFQSHGSRSSSSKRGDLEPNWNFDHGKTGHQTPNDLASPNVVIKPQRRQTRYLSREKEPARERRHSQDRRQLYEPHQQRESNNINQEWRPPHKSHQRRQSRDSKW